MTGIRNAFLDIGTHKTACTKGHLLAVWKNTEKKIRDHLVLVQEVIRDIRTGFFIFVDSKQHVGGNIVELHVNRFFLSLFYY